MTERLICEITGTVQGVGFRPFIYRTAHASQLGGWIKNMSGKVRVCLEGEAKDIEKFLEEIKESPPPNSRIHSIREISREKINSAFIKDFRILESHRDNESQVAIPPDLAICAECEKEISDPDNRRFRYPFTTCTACGPRYTVIESMPYDRENTSMKEFPLCAECEKEYKNPHDRRFHAESTACAECGPSLFLAKSENKITSSGPKALSDTKPELGKGKIIAIRGLGGFHLATDAFNTEALKELRERKKRPHKPFAVMMRNMDTVEKYCRINPKEIEELKSPEAPILILDVRKETGAEKLPLELLSPDSNTLGVMLPYTPLHKMLFEKLDENDIAFEVLVMTSGNRRGEPVCISNQEAFERLEGIADIFLCHNREIVLRNDDSIRVFNGATAQTWRRARGFAPSPLKIKDNIRNNVLAMGAELKNAIALAYGNEIVLSPHIGDLETPEANLWLEKSCECLTEFLGHQPQIIAVDMHPDMHSTVYGQKLAREKNIPVVEVQHHHAHALSCMAEHGLNRALALVFDGTGLGTDGKIWGAELMECDYSSFKRLATFKSCSLPGGDAAVINPARQLAARFICAGCKNPPKKWLEHMNTDEKEYGIWAMQCKKGLNAPESHAAGRLFDSFSALLGLTEEKISYEAQAAIKLESLAATVPDAEAYILEFGEYEKDGMLFIDWEPVFRRLFEEGIPAEKEKAHLAYAFHEAVAAAAIRMIEFACEKSPLRDIVFSGGVFMNRLLNKILLEKARKTGIKIHTHRLVPPNDGGIAAGQALAVGQNK